LVDSSLDWGQDLPSLKVWLNEHQISDAPGFAVYLSYFGSGSPPYHAIPARLLPCYFDYEPRNIEFPLRPGTYCVSATMLQGPVLPILGPWARPYERDYQDLRQELLRYQAMSPAERADYEASLHGSWPAALHQFEQLQLARLFSYLRRRDPDALIAHTILVFRLSASDLQQALVEPPAELAEDIPEFMRNR
jgi:hypothetical protein